MCQDLRNAKGKAAVEESNESITYDNGENNPKAYVFKKAPARWIYLSFRKACDYSLPLEASAFRQGSNHM